MGSREALGELCSVCFCVVPRCLDLRGFTIGASILFSRVPYDSYMGVSENTGPEYRTPNSRVLIIRTPA